MLLKFILPISSLILFNHPINFIFVIIFSALSSIFFSNFFLKNSWFGLLFILLLLSGILILFMYMASLSSNETFSFNKGIFFLMPLCFTFPNINFWSSPLENFKINFISSSPQFFNCFFGLIYLLLSMIFIIELISPMKTPLRSNF